MFEQCSARRASYAELLVQGLSVGPPMKGIQHPLMQNTLLNLAIMFKEYDSQFAMEDCD